MKVEQRLYKREETGLSEEWIKQQGGIVIEEGGGAGGGTNLEKEQARIKAEEEAEQARIAAEAEDNDDSDDEPSEEEIRIQELEDKADELSDEEKQELEELKDSIKPTIFKVRDSYDYEELKDKEYSNDAEGFAQLSKDVAAIEVKNNLEQLHSTNPVLAELYDHVVNKGLSEELFVYKRTPEDFESFDLGSDEGQQKTLSLFYKQKGVSEDDANDLIESFVNKGVLEQKAKDAKKQLVEAKQANILAIEEQEKEERLKAEETSKKIQQELNQVFKTKKAGNYTIPDEDLAPFKNFIYGEADKEGLTPRDRAYNKLTIGERALYDYILMKGLKVKGLDVKTVVDRINLDSRKKDNDSRSALSLGNNGSKQGKKIKELDINSVDMSKATIVKD